MSEFFEDLRLGRWQSKHFRIIEATSSRGPIYNLLDRAGWFINSYPTLEKAIEAAELRQS